MTLYLTRTTKFRLTSILLGLFALAAGAVAWSVSDPIVGGKQITQLIVLGSLAVLAINFEIELQANVAMSGHIMITTASFIVFWKSGFFPGPFLLGICSGLWIEHIRTRQFSKIVVNSSVDCISLLAGSISFWLVADSVGGSTPALLLATVAAVVTWAVVDSLLLGVGAAILYDEPYSSSVMAIARINVIGMPFALFGLGFGWACTEIGLFIAPLLLVPIFVARQSYAGYVQLKAAQEQTIETLISALEAKDRYTAGHAHRVATFSEYVGEEMNFGPRRMERLRYAALMHDIGKLIVPNQLLNKPGRLTESEFERVKRHEFVSVELLRRIDFLAPVAGDTTTEAANAAVTGNGLVEPAIIHVADAFDAMTSTRPYRKALSQETAFDELRKGSGTQFHPGCVDALISSLDRRGERYGEGHEDDVHEWDVAPPEAGTGSAGLGDLAEERRTKDRAAAQ
jgi:hypothetical protein